MTLSWHLPWHQGKDNPFSLCPELGPGHRGKTLTTSRSLCTKPALDFPCSLLEGREEELKCNEMRGIFRLMIDAPAVKGRWQSAEQLLGVSRMQGDIRFPLRGRCTWLATPCFPFSFQTTHFFPTPYFFSDSSRPAAHLWCCISLLSNERGVSEPCDEPGDKAGLSVSSL